MTISGSSSGIGSSQQPSITEIEQTAATQNAKTADGMALVKDTLTLSFHELGGQIGRYPANPGRPVLPPLISTRGPSGSESGNTGDWQKALSALVDRLPLAVQNDYKTQMALPFDQRNLNFVALDNVLVSTAMSLGWLEGVSGASSTEGISSLDIALNLALPYVMLEGFISYAGASLSRMTDFLDAAGSNYPQQDALRQYVRLASKGLGEMAILQAQKESTGIAPLDEFASLSSKMTAIAAQNDRIYVGDDLFILSATLHAMATITASLSVAETASPLFFLTLANSSIGINSQESATGMIGTGLASATSTISIGLSALLMSKASPAMQDLLNKTVTLIFLSSIAFATLINDVGIGPFPSRDPAEVEAARAFSTELAFSVAINSGLVSSTISALVATFGLAYMQEQYMEESMKLLALTSMILATAPNGDPQNAIALFDSFQGSISKSLHSLSDLISEGIINHTLTGAESTRLGIFLGQAQIALEEGNLNDFIAALLAPLSLAGTSEEQWMNDIGAIKNDIQKMNSALTNGINDQTSDTRVSFIV